MVARLSLTVAVALLGVLGASVPSAQAFGCSTDEWFSAARIGDDGALLACLARNFNVNSQDELGCTALVTSTANMKTSTVEVLIGAGANVNAACRSGNTALMYAAKLGSLENCKALFAAGADIGMQGPNELTALSMAARHGHQDVVTYLHSHEIGSKETFSGNELMWAAAHGELGLVREALDRGRDVNAEDKIGNTALTWAARLGSLAGVKALLGHGAKLHHKTHNGWTAFMQAAYHGQVKVLRHLVEAGSEKDETDKIGWTAAMWAASRNDIDTLAYLHSARATLQPAKGAVGGGWSPMMVAASCGHFESVQFLLRHGAAWELKNDQQETAEAIAQQKQHWDIYNSLKKARVATEYETARHRKHQDL